MNKIKVEVENLELALKNSHGDIVIIPKDKRAQVEQMIKDKCWSCVDRIVSVLPTMEDYAEDGSLLPDWDKVKATLNPKNWGVTDYTDEEGNPCAKMGLTNATKGTGWKIVKDFKGQPKHSQGGVDITVSDNGVSMRRGGKDIKAKFGLLIPATLNVSDTLIKKVKVNQGNQIKEYDTSSPKYKYLYNSGKLMGYDKTSDTYIAPPLKEVTITGEAPQWIKDKKNKKVNKINFWESLNYKKWGLNDYSDYSSFNSAFRNARENSEKEFVYKGNRYNTNLISKEQSDLYHESKQFLIDYYKNNDFKPININIPYDIKDKYIKNKHGITWSEYYDQVKDSDRYDINSEDFDKIQQRLDELDTYNKDFDNDEDYKIFVDNYIKSEKEKEKEKELNNLQDPYYFSITDQKSKDLKADGYLNSGRKKIFLTTNAEKDKLNTTYVHELSHKADDHSVYSRTPKIDIDYINKNRDIYPLNKETFNYLNDPSEIEARKMSLLFFAYKNKIDVTKMDDSEFDKFYTDNFDKFPYDIKQLFNLYSFQRKDLLKYIKNDFSYLQSQNKK